MNRWTITALCASALFVFIGCRAVNTVDTAETTPATESDVIFTRSQELTPWFGTHSPHDYFEIVYKKFSRNDAGFPVVEIGLRYRGGVSWTDWFEEVPQVVELHAVCNFYRIPDGPIVYATNAETLLFNLGRTTHFKAVCPVKEAETFQLVLGK